MFGNHKNKNKFSLGRKKMKENLLALITIFFINTRMKIHFFLKETSMKIHRNYNFSCPYKN